LYGHFAAFAAAWIWHAALVRFIGNCRDVVSNLFRPVRITDINRSYPSVEIGHKHDPFIVDRSKRLVTGMCSEAAAARAEIAARLRHIEIGYGERSRLVCDVDEKTICRYSRHSFWVASVTMTTKSAVFPFSIFDNSGIVIPSTGKAVCAPVFG